MYNLKIIFLVILSMLNDLYQWIIARLPFRKNLCFIFDHRYKSVWLKDTHLDKTKGEGVMIADTEGGCIYCGYTKKNKWNKNLIDWERSKK